MFGGDRPAPLSLPRTKAWKWSARMMQLLILAIAAAIWIISVLVGSIVQPATMEETRVELNTVACKFWKDDLDVSTETVLSRISYWTYGKVFREVDFELVDHVPHTKFLTFEPDVGGFNNIRMQVEILVQIARATRRTLVLPPNQHWSHLKGESNLGDFFQLDMAADYLSIVTLDEYLTVVGAPIRSEMDPAEIFAFLRDHNGSYSPNWSPDRQALILRHDAVSERVPSAEQFLNGRSPLYYDQELASHRNLHFRSDYLNGYRLLGVPCTFVYYPTLQWERYAYAILRNGFHFRHETFAAAASVIQKILSKSGRYNAVHVRRADFRSQYADKVVGWEELGRNLKKILDMDLPVYIATDENAEADDGFDVFRSFFKNIFLLKDFQLPDDVPYNWGGLIEQIGAERFIGTELSTFTAYIHRLRGYMAADVAPDKNMYYTTDQFTGYALVDGWRTYRTWMRLSDHDVADDPGGYWQREYWISWQG